MNQSDFEADLRRHGYQVFYGGLKADHVNTDHSQDWDARVMVIGGEITLRRQGKSATFRIGDSCTVAAGEVHAEQAGPKASHTLLDAAHRRRSTGAAALPLILLRLVATTWRGLGITKAAITAAGHQSYSVAARTRVVVRSLEELAIVAIVGAVP
jgi:hypothetical protein